MTPTPAGPFAEPPAPALSETSLFTLDVAREAAALVMRILPESSSAKEVRHKGATDLVTRADHEAERLIAGRIRARFPDHGLLGEEGTASSGLGPRWLVDPVDGTANFAHGVPWFAISIGLEDRGAVQCGVVAVPPLGEYFVAERGRGAYLLADGAAPIRLAVSTTLDLGQALVATGLPREPDRGRHVPTIAPLMMRALEVRIMGVAAIHLSYVAAGSTRSGSPGSRHGTSPRESSWSRRPAAGSPTGRGGRCAGWAARCWYPTACCIPRWSRCWPATPAPGRPASRPPLATRGWPPAAGS